jgi:hypothetical protein
VLSATTLDGKSKKYLGGVYLDLSRVMASISMPQFSVARRKPVANHTPISALVINLSRDGLTNLELETCCMSLGTCSTAYYRPQNILR